MIRVVVLLLDGGLPSTAIVPVEILHLAGVAWGVLTDGPVERRFDVRTASVTGRAVRSPVPMTVTPHFAVRNVRSADLIIVPSMGPHLVEGCTRNRAVIPWLRRRHARGTAIAGVCSGVALMAEAGLLDHRPATTHWALVDLCRRRYPNVRWRPECFVTESDKVFCGGGVYASVDLSLYLVEKYCGHQIAMQTAKSLLLETPRVWQTGYAADPPDASHRDDRIRRAQDWMFQHFSEAVRVEDLADRVAMSSRSFARSFKVATGDTPINYLHRLRVNAARHALENEPKTIREVCNAVGYDDLTFFRRLFKRYTGAPPRDYRQRFGIVPPNGAAIATRGTADRRTRTASHR